MRSYLTFLAVLILSLFLCAMTPLTESNMSNASNPFSLNTNIDNMMSINIGSKTWGDSSVISKFLLNSINLTWNVDLSLDESNGETIETQETSKDFSDPLLCWGQGWFDNLQSYILDLFNNPLVLINYYTTPNSQVINAEGINDTNSSYRWIQTTNKPSISYAYPYDETRIYAPCRYDIMDGNLELRDTYINNTITIIQSGSYTNIRTH